MILACDLGGGSFRSAVIGVQGNARAGPSLVTPDASHDGVDPERWWTAFQQAAAGLLLEDVEAVAISGFTRTQVFLDADGHSVRPAMLFNDARAASVLPLAAAPGINEFHPLARLAWLTQHEPENASRLAAVVEPKDFLNLRLTGRLAVDRVGSAPLLAARHLLPRIGLSPDIIPPVMEPTAVMGRVRHFPGALSRLAGRPVVAMATDTWASVLGLGALRDGFAYNLSGTTEVLGLLSYGAARAEGLVSVDFGSGLHQLGGPSLCGGDTLDWLMALLGRDGPIGPAFDDLLAQPPIANLLFLPYLQGERVPHWDSALRGAFIGLARGHGPSDCAWAVLEGIAFINRLVLERASAAIGAGPREIRFGGGGAASVAWAQLKADVTGCDYVLGDAAEPGLLGAAIAGFTAIGAFPDLAAAQAAMVRERHRYHPHPSGRHERLFRLFQDADAAIAPISRALATA